LANARLVVNPETMMHFRRPNQNSEQCSLICRVDMTALTRLT
jgi:hypothetical protein